MSKSDSTSSWFELVRVANLPTVVGDPLVGFLLAGGLYGGTDGRWLRAGVAVAAALLFYVRGTISNDFFDLSRDRIERPERPLPSGRINPWKAFLASMVFGVLGLVASAVNGRESCVVGIGLIVAIAAYNRFLKRIPVIGPLNMGLCRALSLLLGASAAGWSGQPDWCVITPAVLLGLYIASITAIAKAETRTCKIGLKRYFPAVVLALALPILYGCCICYTCYINDSQFNAAAFSLLFTVCIVIAWRYGWSLRGEAAPDVIQRTVGKFIFILPVIQAAMASLAGMEGLVVAVSLLPAMAICYFLGRKYPPS